MVKISAFPKCWIEDLCAGKMDLFEWFDLSRQLECDGLEMLDGFLQSKEDSYLETVRDAVERMGMQIPMICYSPDFTRPTASEREEEVEKQIAMMDVAKKLGASFLRILSGQKRPGLDIDEGVNRVVACIRQCLPAAEKKGVTLVMENHYKDSFWVYPEFAQKMEIFLRIIRQIDSPNFGVQFDPSNSLVAGEDPLKLLDACAAGVRTMHASDRYILPGHDLAEVMEHAGAQGYHPALQHGVVGQGLNDYPGIFQRLAAAGFNGWISIEDGMNGMEEMRRSVDYLKEMRAVYFPEP